MRFTGIIAMCVTLSLGFASCNGTQENKTEKKTSSLPKEDKEEVVDTKDIFFYTPQHRKDKYVPTEEKMGFNSQILYTGESEFEGNTSIKEIWFSPKINHIMNKSFKGCTALEKAHFQGPVAVINDEAFMGCKNLKAFSGDAWTVGVDAFKDCTSLEKAHFGEHVWWIRTGAFENCRNLKSILLRITMEKLDDGAFTGCTGLEEVTIPNNFKNRMFGMFAPCKKMKKIYLLSTEYFAMPKNCEPLASCTLYVPDAFLKQYQEDANWSKYGSIEPLSKTKYFTAEGFWK